MEKNLTKQTYHNHTGNLSETNFSSIKITLASPEKIKSWSFGEIKKPETINYRTFRPEKDGLFCARIFGPVKDYECLCGKYKRMKFRGIICEKCGVEITKSNVRRERMGHIDLACPVAHIWFLKSLPSRIALAVDMKLKDVERVLYFESFIVVEPGLTTLQKGQLINEEQLMKAQEEFGEDAFEAGIGAEAVREILLSLDLAKEQKKLRTALETIKSKVTEERTIKRLKLVESFIDSGNKPEWMILTTVPVIPPELRPLVPLDGGRFATSDLNDLYRRVINRNNRLKRLLDLKAPDIIVRNEKRMLQESVDALFDNGRRGRVITGTGKRPLKSLAEMLKGKQGRFRQNLLGKRVDYSGRSVIVVGPELKLHQCGLPKKMALELFKPFLYARLDKLGLATTIKQAKRLVEKEVPEVWDALEFITREHPILLNRAPTLHRLGVQAFEVKLIEGYAIELHPLVCAAFNADFDGDQMAVHIPLSLEAQLEARVLMMSTNNILSPSNGKPIIVPSQDIVLGIYYLSQANDKDDKPKGIFSDIEEISQAIENKSISLHTRLVSVFETVDEKGNLIKHKYTSTAGRFLLASVLPKHHKIKFTLVDRLLAKKNVSEIIDTIFRFCGQKETVIFCDRIKSLGFKHAFKAGISFGKDDLIIPETKTNLINQTKKQIEEYEKQYSDGLITRGEKYNKVVDVWSKCTDTVANEMMKEISSAQKIFPDGRIETNSVFMMADSGARGSQAQMKQLAGMRGLIAKPSGEIIETPIMANFKEGLTVLEYFNSTHGARKGLADTALKTANSGYLTRRLCDVAQDLQVTIKDCGSKSSINITEIIEGGNILVSLSERVLGRTPAQDIKHPITGETIIKKKKLLDESDCELIDAAGVKAIQVFSVITCAAQKGVCQTCYGRDLSRGKLVSIGEAIGMIAAQSIGEPGTQLTMRTFHVGGTAQIKEESQIISQTKGKLKIINKNLIEDSKKNIIVMGRNTELSLEDDASRQLAIYKVNYGSKIFFKDGDIVEKGKKIAEWDPYTLPVIAETSGIVNYMDLVEGTSLTETMDDATGISSKSVTDWKSLSKNTELKPRITLRDDKGEVIKKADGNVARYFLVPDSILSVKDGQKVSAGDVLARLPKETSKTKDITGGLPRVAELFEARKPKDSAIIAENDGVIEFGKEIRGKQKISIISSKGETSNYLIPKGKHVNFNQGEKIKKGEYLLDGAPLPHDILRILGVERLTEYFVSEVQEVYRLQGVVINDKHIETIVRQMLKKVEIKEPGDTDFLLNETVDIIDIIKINEDLKKEGKKPSTYERILLGITKASLQTKSFISAASFQETTRVLTDASIKGKVDYLQGLKENVIVGRLVPAGTGLAKMGWDKEARKQDELRLEELKKQQLENPAPTE
jgi:DNA-directed RNA polymerase subunit beta'